MKTLFKLILLALFCYLGYFYISQNPVLVKQLANKASDWLNDGREALESINKTSPQVPKSDDDKGSLGTEAYNRLSPKFKTNHSKPELKHDDNTEIDEDLTSDDSENDFPEETSLANENTLAPISNNNTIKASITTSSNLRTVTNSESDECEVFDVSILPNESDPYKWVKGASSELSPSSWNMLLLYDKLPANSEIKTTDDRLFSSPKPAETFHYLKGNNRASLISSMGTNVHEIAHGYFSYGLYDYLLKSGKVSEARHVELILYLNNYQSIFVSVPKEILFPSRTLAKVIPKDLITFRYNTYIEGNTSTQNQGVVGLLDEFCAYYLGSKYEYDMLNAYKSTNSNSAIGFLQWVTNLQSSMSAYYEFDYFIREYLLYMKINSPSDYQLLKQSAGFKEAYSKFKSAYKELNAAYETQIDKHIAFYNNSGKAYCYIEDGVLFVGKSKTGQFNGSSIFSKDKKRLMSVLNSDRYNSVAEFLQ